jgi:hypothetical protein
MPNVSVTLPLNSEGVQVRTCMPTLPSWNLPVRRRGQPEHLRAGTQDAVRRASNSVLLPASGILDDTTQSVLAAAAAPLPRTTSQP